MMFGAKREKKIIELQRSCRYFSIYAHIYWGKDGGPPPQENKIIGKLHTEILIFAIVSPASLLLSL